MATLTIGGKTVVTQTGTDEPIMSSNVNVSDALASATFPAGHVIQTKVIKDSTARGGFGSQGDTYTGVSITFDNNLSSTNSVVLIEASLQIDIQNDTGYGFTWGASSTTLSGNKIGVEGSTITNFSRGSSPYINGSRHGDHVSFITCDSNIISVTPKTYYLWVINSYSTNIYMNTHINVNQGQQFATNFWTGSSTAVYKLTEIAE